MEGADGGTSFVDTSPNNHSMTVTSATTSATQRKFGLTSCALTGSSKLSCTVTALGTSDFTIEFWFRINTATTAAYGTLFAIGAADSVGMLYLSRNASTTPVQFQLGGYTGSWIMMVNPGATTVMTDATWVHVAAVRSGNVWKLYIGGADSGTGTTTSYTLTGATLHIGNNPAGTAGVGGYIDDFRFTRGVARYTANFTPPARPHYSR